MFCFFKYSFSLSFSCGSLNTITTNTHVYCCLLLFSCLLFSEFLRVSLLSKVDFRKFSVVIALHISSFSNCFYWPFHYVYIPVCSYSIVTVYFVLFFFLWLSNFLENCPQTQIFFNSVKSTNELTKDVLHFYNSFNL